jgi:uncharacterized membrane protein
MASPPPLPPTGPRETGSTNLGVAPNVGGLLCYAPCCIGLIFSIVAVIVEKQSRFLRFHAFQSLLVHGVMLLLWVALMILGLVLSVIHLGLLMLPIQVLVLVAAVGLEIYLMVKAYNNEEYELPTVGQMARKWI